MPTQKNGRWFCDAIGKDEKPCGGMMRYRRRTDDYACTMCPCTIPLSHLTPTQPEVKPAQVTHASDGERKGLSN